MLCEGCGVIWRWQEYKSSSRSSSGCTMDLILARKCIRLPPVLPFSKRVFLLNGPKKFAVNNCVYRNEITHDVGERTQVLQDVAADPTLPRTKTVRCAVCSHPEAVFSRQLQGGKKEWHCSLSAVTRVVVIDGEIKQQLFSIVANCNPNLN